MSNNKQSSVSKYQNKIVEALKSGARLQSSEGKNYKCWLVYSDGKEETVRRDSANKVCLEYESKLKFGELEGVKWKTINISTQGGNNE
jgi:hypothetical protein